MKFLFYRDREGIGDIVMMTRAIELTRLKYPKVEIIVQCLYPELLTSHPAIDEVANLNVIVTDYDLLINQNACCADYESVIKIIEKSRAQVFCENTAKYLTDAKIEGIQWDGLPQSLWISPEMNQWSETYVQNASNRKLSIALFGKSAQDWKTYPHVAALLKLLVADKDLAIFYFDTTAEIPFWGVHQVVGYSLDKVLALVANMDLVISPDSAGLHFAGSFNIPTIGIFGPTNPLLLAYQNMAWVQPIKCPYHPCWYNYCPELYCLKRIKPRQIYNMVYERKNMLRQLSKKRFPNVSNMESNLYTPPQMTPEQITIPSRPPEDRQKIVIVRMKGIGDVLISWFGLEVLRGQYPQAHITYVTSRNCADLFYGQDTLIDRVVVSSWDYPPKGIPKLPPDIMNLPADKLIDLTNRIDFHDTIEASLGDRALLHTSPRADNLAKLMGVSLDGNVIQRYLKIPEEADRWAFQILVKNNLGRQKEAYKLVCCQLDAKGATRQWHIQRWIQLSELLIEANYGVIWFSVTPEHRLIDIPGVLNLSCQTSLAQMIALMSKCQYAVSTCSASIHIAHRLSETAPIGIYGSTDYKLLAAYYDDLIPITNYTPECAPCADWGHECLGQLGAPWCINQISPRTVLRTINECLSTG